MVIMWFACSAGEENSLLLGTDYANVVLVFWSFGQLKEVPGDATYSGKLSGRPGMTVRYLSPLCVFW